MVQRMVCFHLITVLLLYGAVLQVQSASSEVHLKLLGDLMDNYIKPFLRPVNDTTRPVEVGVRFTPVFSTLDEAQEELIVRGMLALKWTDFRLAWEPADYDGIKETNIPLSVKDEQKVWIPEIFLYECLVTEFQSLFTETKTVTLMYTGVIHWYTLATTKTFCTVENRKFPFDVQICNLTFTTWVYLSNEQVFYEIDDLVKDDTYKNYELKNALWTVKLLQDDVDVGMSTYDCETCKGEKQSYIMFKLELTRGQSFLLVCIFIFPCVVIALLMICVTCLSGKADVDAPIYALTCVLTLFVYLTFLYTRLPPTGASPIEIIILLMALGGVFAVSWAVCTARDSHVNVKSRTSDKKVQVSSEEGAASASSSAGRQGSEGEHGAENVGPEGAETEQPVAGSDKQEQIIVRQNWAHTAKHWIPWQCRRYNCLPRVFCFGLIVYQFLLILVILLWVLIAAVT